jgi:hypothetical protein
VREPRSYVVKVYRQQRAGAAGTVQDVRTGRTMPFQTMEELWDAVRRFSPPSVKQSEHGSASSDPSHDVDQANRGEES